MEKSGPTLPTWNTLKTRLLQFKESILQVVRTDSTQSNFKSRKEDPSLTNTFKKNEISSYWFIPSNRVFHISKNTEADKRVSARHFRRYFQHAHFIPIVGVGKRGAY